MNQEDLDKTFRFIQKIKWQAIIDFDDQGSDSKGLCKVFKGGPNTPQYDIHEAEDYNEDDNAVENIYYKTHWIFANGYAKLGKEAAGFKQWNNSKRKRGLTQVILSLAKTIPEVRAVVMFLLLSKEYQPMADTFKDFCTHLDGPNQLVYVAENSEIAKGWEETLSNTCLEEHELRERGVVGMSWTEFQECMQQMVCGTDRHQLYVTMATGSPYPLGNVSFNGIEIVSAKECEELNNFKPCRTFRSLIEENYNPKYSSSIVERHLDLVTSDELTLLEYTSLLNIYNPYPVFASCFDTLMLPSNLLRERIFKDWVENLTHSARIFLREVDRSTHSGTGKAIAIVHPIIAGELLDQISARKETTVSKITLEYLKSPLLQSGAKSFTSRDLLDGANRMLKNRKKYEYGDDVETKFSPLIEKILYVKDAGDGQKEPTEQSIQEAADVLMEGFNKFKDPMLAQQMARVFYVNAAAFSESRIDECFGKAYEYCKMANEMKSKNTFFLIPWVAFMKVK
ncbi:sterile alpha motif [Desmophyllum pertusum]|uniref:Sterile alpha motif n=1 Tax=Desmophyllum pertusum TaxID=174260 RepID=A0A9W9YR68_9CNID|nr:sterile alpha motif [Desmophyllum pertusum]